MSKHCSYTIRHLLSRYLCADLFILVPVVASIQVWLVRSSGAIVGIYTAEHLIEMPLDALIAQA